MRIGSLFSGAAGLDRAVAEVFGGEVVWFSEIDRAASKVLAHRFPGVPNLGDITAVDWADVPAVDVLCGGFPCQDVSAAGKRAGIKYGTRSGLWSVFAEAIDQLRPRIVVIENVRGLLSATAHRTVEDAESGDMESPTAGVGDGAGRPVLRAAGAVLGDLADLGYDAQWATVAAADVGAPHRRERVFIVATAADANVYRPEASEWELIQMADWFDGRVAALGGDEPGVALLPTPCAQQSGNSPEEHLRKKPGRKVVTDLAILVENGLLESGGALLPTPNAQDGNGGKAPRGGRDTHNTGTKRQVPLTDIPDLLPTPNASDGSGGGQHPDKREGHSRQLIDYVLALGEESNDGHPNTGSRWGRYEAAIRRWERVLGRSAPAPTEPNKKGNPRLAAEFSSWLMGWPPGWVTDPAIGISRNDQLRIVGNGVCPQQAAASLRFLLAVTA